MKLFDLYQEKNTQEETHPVFSESLFWCLFYYLWHLIHKTIMYPYRLKIGATTKIERQLYLEQWRQLELPVISLFPQMVMLLYNNNRKSKDQAQSNIFFKFWKMILLHIIIGIHLETMRLCTQKYRTVWSSTKTSNSSTTIPFKVVVICELSSYGNILLGKDTNPCFSQYCPFPRFTIW